MICVVYVTGSVKELSAPLVQFGACALTAIPFGVAQQLVRRKQRGGGSTGARGTRRQSANTDVRSRHASRSEDTDIRNSDASRSANARGRSWDESQSTDTDVGERAVVTPGIGMPAAGEVGVRAQTTATTLVGTRALMAPVGMPAAGGVGVSTPTPRFRATRPRLGVRTNGLAGGV